MASSNSKVTVKRAKTTRTPGEVTRDPDQQVPEVEETADEVAEEADIEVEDEQGPELTTEEIMNAVAEADRDAEPGGQKSAPAGELQDQILCRILNVEYSDFYEARRIAVRVADLFKGN